MFGLWQEVAGRRRGCSRTRNWALRRFPEIDREELFRFFTLTPADLAFIDPGRGRGPVDRLGLAVALCTLPWLGFVPDDVDQGCC
ncbi:DUF4158 domain-containing protein [Streptosporangium sp. NPDC002607]